MKKFILLCLVLIFSALIFAEGKGPEEDKPIPPALSCAVLNGPTGLGTLAMMGSSPYSFDLVTDPKLLIPSLVQGQYQAAVVPSNMGALLHAKGAPYSIAAVVGYGVLYVVGSSDPLQGIKDLQDKTLYLSGKGATPDYLTQYLLHNASMQIGEDIQLDYSFTHPDLTRTLIAGRVDYALLPEPFCTMALQAREDLNIVLDYQAEWEQTQGRVYPISVLLVSNELKQQEQLLETFLSDYRQSIQWVNNHPLEAAAKAPEQGFTLSTEVLEEAIPRCNLQFSPLQESRQELDAFFSVLYNLNPASIGGELPSDESYLY